MNTSASFLVEVGFLDIYHGKVLKNRRNANYQESILML